MEQPRFKGIGLKSFLDWVEARHGKPAREEALTSNELRFTISWQ